MPFNMTPAALAEGRADLAAQLEAASGDRTIDDVHITVSPDRDSAAPERAADFAEAGADQLLVHLRRRVTVDDLDETLDELAAANGLV